MSQFRATSADDAICCVCEGGESTEENPILLCDGLCSLAYHHLCISEPSEGGTVVIPEGSWFCSSSCAQASAAAADEAASSTAAAAAAGADGPIPLYLPQLSDAQLTDHIKLKRAERQHRVQAEALARHAAKLALHEKPSPLAPAAPLDDKPSGEQTLAELNWETVQSSADLWAACAPYFDASRLCQEGPSLLVAGSLDGEAEAAFDKLVAEGGAEPDDEVAQELAHARELLVEQIEANNLVKGGLRENCTARSAFDGRLLEAKQALDKEHAAVSADYRERFPSAYVAQIEAEQAQAELLQRAARAAGKSVSTRRAKANGPKSHRQILAAMSEEERAAYDEQKRKERNRRQTERRRELRLLHQLERLQAEMDEESSGDEEGEEEEAGDGSSDYSDEYSPMHPPHTPNHARALVRRSSTPSSSRSGTPPHSGSRRSTVGGKAPRSSAGPGSSGDNVIVIPRPRGAFAAALQAKVIADAVRSCVEQLVSAVEQIDRSSAVAKCKSEKIAQLRERRIKRQEDMAAWEEKRNTADQCQMALSAVIAQLELDFSQEECKPAFTHAQQSACESRATATAAPRRTCSSGDESAASTPCAMDMDSPSAAAEAARSDQPVPTATEKQETAHIPIASTAAGASAASASAAAAAAVSTVAVAAAAPAVSLSPPIRLPAAHLYVELSYCPRDHRPYSIGVPWVRCDGCGEWWHSRCMGFISPEEIVQCYRHYCKPCQERGHSNVPIAAGSRRKRSTKQHDGLLPYASNLPDLALSLHASGLDDTERLEREEEEEEKQLVFLHLAERHQNFTLVDENGNEVKPNTRRKKERVLDEDELAVLADPHPWEWLKVRMHRLLSTRMTLTKSQRRRGDAKFELIKPLIHSVRYFPMTSEGTKEYKRAKFFQSLPTSVKRKIANRDRYYKKVVGPHRQPRAAYGGGGRHTCPDCKAAYQTASALTRHVKYRHTLWMEDGRPVHSVELIPTDAPRWNGRRKSKRKTGEDGKETEEDAAGTDATESDCSAAQLSGTDDEATGDGESESVHSATLSASAAVPSGASSPSQFARIVSRSGRQARQLVLDALKPKRRRSDGLPYTSPDGVDEAAAHSAQPGTTEDEDDVISLTRLRAQQDAVRAIRAQRADEHTLKVLAQRERRAAATAARKQQQDGKKKGPLAVPEFPASEHLRVVVARSHEKSKRIKLRLRITKKVLSVQLLQDIKRWRQGQSGEMKLRPRRVSRFESSSSSSSSEEEDLRPGCVVCGSSADERKVLLCDRCDRECHMYCCDPPLAHVPRGSFFCPRCKDAPPLPIPEPPPLEWEEEDQNDQRDDVTADYGRCGGGGDYGDKRVGDDASGTLDPAALAAAFNRGLQLLDVELKPQHFDGVLADAILLIAATKPRGRKRGPARRAEKDTVDATSSLSPPPAKRGRRAATDAAETAASSTQKRKRSTTPTERREPTRMLPVRACNQAGTVDQVEPDVKPLYEVALDEPPRLGRKPKLGEIRVGSNVTLGPPVFPKPIAPVMATVVEPAQAELVAASPLDIRAVMPATPITSSPSPIQAIPFAALKLNTAKLKRSRGATAVAASLHMSGAGQKLTPLLLLPPPPPRLNAASGPIDSAAPLVSMPVLHSGTPPEPTPMASPSLQLHSPVEAAAVSSSEDGDVDVNGSPRPRKKARRSDGGGKPSPGGQSESSMPELQSMSDTGSNSASSSAASSVVVAAMPILNAASSVPNLNSPPGGPFALLLSSPTATVTAARRVHSRQQNMQARHSPAADAAAGSGILSPVRATIVSALQNSAAPFASPSPPALALRAREKKEQREGEKTEKSDKGKADAAALFEARFTEAINSSARMRAALAGRESPSLIVPDLDAASPSSEPASLSARPSRIAAKAAAHRLHFELMNTTAKQKLERACEGT